MSFRLGSLFKNSDAINEIIIVTSGCNDNTKEAVESYMIRDRRIRLLIQKKREGKASAVNLFIKSSISEILIISSADIILRTNTQPSRCSRDMMRSLNILVMM